MDESHHYRAELTKESIADLKPLLGLEFSATPSYTKNIIYSYSLGEAVNDYIVKRLEAVVKRDDRSFNEELDDLKLIEGLKIHEKKKTWIEEYCKNYEVEILKPVTFISTKNIAHGDEIQKKIESDKFMKGKYKDKTVYVHSGSEDAQVKQLLTLEEPDNEKEIVIHVNKLQEGWDVKNIFTIIPLRASISTTLTEQTIGRGVRLPFPDATHDHIENFPKAFTLHIIAFSGKDDNYKDVIEKSKKNNIIVKNYDDEIFKEKNIETYEIKPSTKTKHAIPIPVFKGIVKQVNDLDIFEINPNYEELRKDVHAKVETLDLVKQKTYDLGNAVETTKEDLVKFLINRLIEKTNEIGYDDKPVVSKIVEKYLNKAVKSKNKKDWEKYLRKHASTIFDDIQNQISSQVQNTIKIKHSFDKKNWKFEPYFVSKEKEKPLVNKNNFSDEKISNVFKGYEKCVYSEMKFDSKQEKLLADILDEDKQVIRWLKNPVSKYGIPIKYKFGNYYLDFFVETEKKLYALEVKSSKDLQEPTVIEKGKEAKKWCEKISKVSKKPWKYGIIPHDQIKRKDSFNRVLSNIVTF